MMDCLGGVRWYPSDRLIKQEDGTINALHPRFHQLAQGRDLAPQLIGRQRRWVWNGDVGKLTLCCHRLACHRTLSGPAGARCLRRRRIRAADAEAGDQIAIDRARATGTILVEGVSAGPPGIARKRVW